MGVACLMLAFLGMVVLRSEPADPASRLPQRYRLADLIQGEVGQTADLRAQVLGLRADLEAQRARRLTSEGGITNLERQLEATKLTAGLTALGGPGLKVTLDDSSLREPPAGANVNDLVVHSEDVQAVVNALWRSGAQAMSINGQRLVSTSAVLCVGNTLLLNGTVHSPPFVVTAIGANRERFEGDRLVRRLRDDAGRFSRRFSIERDSLEVPAYTGSTKAASARPVT